MILVDTSAWVEFDRATGSAAHRRVTELIGTDGDLAVTEPVIMEVLAGARDERRLLELERLMLLPALLRFDPVADFHAAAELYRTCRRVGVTPRGLVDCMIAAVAQRHGAALLAADVDLHRVADIAGIDIDVADP